MRKLSAVTALCCVLKLCVIVQGLYQVEVSLLGYQNPTGRCQGCPLFDGLRSCCDNRNRNSPCNNINGYECDSIFTYCLRTFGNQDFQEGGCSNRDSITSNFNRNDDSVTDFSQARVLGVANPFLLQGLGNSYIGVQLYIDIQDFDDNEDPVDLVDILLINYNQTVGIPLRQTYSGVHGFVTMDLNITVFCVGNFAEPDCSSQCVTGFTGPDCLTVDNCVGVNCSGNGLCVNGMDSFMCNCSAGYNGSECEMNIDDCLSNPCASTGQCVDGVDSFTCSCDQGYTGQLCDTDIDECEGVDCSGNGECLDGVGSFSCVCSPGYTGQICEISQRVGSVVGGVFGAIIGLILIIVIVVVVVLLVLRRRNRSGGMEFTRGIKNDRKGEGVMPEDNTGHEMGSTTNRSRRQPVANSSVHYVASTSTNIRQRSDSNLQEREFKNPIYGDSEGSGEVVYAAPFENRDRNQSEQEHKFYNPIYGADDGKNAYAVPCDYNM